MRPTFSRDFRSERIITIAISVILTVVIALASALAFGFFAIPVLLLAAFAWIFYRAMVHTRTRNPIRPPHSTIAERWADGKPLGRAVVDEEDTERYEEDRDALHALREQQHKEIDREAAEEAAHHDPADYEGPPPINPFP